MKSKNANNLKGNNVLKIPWPHNGKLHWPVGAYKMTPTQRQLLQNDFGLMKKWKLPSWTACRGPPQEYDGLSCLSSAPLCTTSDPKSAPVACQPSRTFFLKTLSKGLFKIHSTNIYHQQSETLNNIHIQIVSRQNMWLISCFFLTSYAWSTEGLHWLLLESRNRNISRERSMSFLLCGSSKGSTW